MTIYIDLDEGSLTPVFAPVEAVQMSDSIFKITSIKNADKESTQYKNGDYVLCLKVVSNEDKSIFDLAYRKLSKEAAEYLTDKKVNV